MQWNQCCRGLRVLVFVQLGSVSGVGDEAKPNAILVMTDDRGWEGEVSTLSKD